MALKHIETPQGFLNEADETLMNEFLKAHGNSMLNANELEQEPGAEEYLRQLHDRAKSFVNDGAKAVQPFTLKEYSPRLQIHAQLILDLAQKLSPEGATRMAVAFSGMDIRPN